MPAMRELKSCKATITFFSVSTPTPYGAGRRIFEIDDLTCELLTQEADGSFMLTMAPVFERGLAKRFHQNDFAAVSIELETEDETILLESCAVRLLLWRWDVLSVALSPTNVSVTSRCPAQEPDPRTLPCPRLPKEDEDLVGTVCCCTTGRTGIVTGKTSFVTDKGRTVSGWGGIGIDGKGTWFSSKPVVLENDMHAFHDKLGRLFGGRLTHLS